MCSVVGEHDLTSSIELGIIRTSLRWSARKWSLRGKEPTMPNALITGITGQDGLYLAELLIGKGYDVYGLVRGQNNPKLQLVRDTVPQVKLLTGDLSDVSSLVRTLAHSQPDEVYNLGAI